MATDGGSLLGILCWETGVEAEEETHCSCSKAPWRCRLMATVISLGGSIVSARGWVSTGVVMGAWMAVVIPSGYTWLRFTSRSCGSQKGSPGEATSQRGSSGKVNCRASSSLFKPLGNNTLSPCCSSLHTCSWLHQLQVSALGMLSVMALMCPSFDRGTWETVSFSCTKAYDQSVLSSASSMSL